jgi:DNA primase
VQEVGRAVASARTRAPERAKPAYGEPSAQPSAPVQEAGPSLVQLPIDVNTRMERDALMAILQYPREVGLELTQKAAQVAFGNGTLAVVRDGVAASIEDFGSPHWVERVITEVPAPFANLVRELTAASIPEKTGRDLTVYCQAITTDLIGRGLLRRKAEVLGQLQRTDAAAEPERYRELQRESMRIEAERRALRPEA